MTRAEVEVVRDEAGEERVEFRLEDGAVVRVSLPAPKHDAPPEVRARPLQAGAPEPARRNAGHVPAQEPDRRVAHTHTPNPTHTGTHGVPLPLLAPPPCLVDAGSGGSDSGGRTSGARGARGGRDLGKFQVPGLERLPRHP